MSKLKTALTALGVTGAITLVTVGSLPKVDYPEQKGVCPENQVLVSINKEKACIYDTIYNKKAALYADLISDKKDEKGENYDFGGENYGVYQSILPLELTESDIAEIKKQAKKGKISIQDVLKIHLNPNKPE